MAEDMIHSLDESQRRETCLSTAEIVEKLTEPKDTVLSIPFRPKGGSLYTFYPATPAKNDDWKADGHS